MERARTVVVVVVARAALAVSDLTGPVSFVDSGGLNTGPNKTEAAAAGAKTDCTLVGTGVRRGRGVRRASHGGISLGVGAVRSSVPS